MIQNSPFAYIIDATEIKSTLCAIFTKVSIFIIVFSYIPNISAEPNLKEISLKEAEQMAISANHEIQVAKKRVQVAAENRKIAFSKFLPSLGLSAGVSLNGPEVKIGSRKGTNLFAWNTTLNASLTLLDPTLFPLYQKAKSQVDASNIQAHWVEDTVKFETQQAFLLLATAQAELLIAKKNLEHQETYLELAEALVQQGLGLPVDKNRATLQKLQAEQTVDAARNQVQTYATQLEILLGHDPKGILRAKTVNVEKGESISTPFSKNSVERREESFVQMSNVETTAKDDPPNDLETQPPKESFRPTRPSPAYVSLFHIEIPEVLPGLDRIEQRADIQEQRLRITEAELEESVAFWSFFPTLSLQATTRLNTANFSSPDGYSWSISLALHWNIFSGGSKLYNKQRRELERDIAQIQYDQQKQKARAKLSQVVHDWHHAKRSMALAKEAKRVAQQTYDEVIERYKAGLATSIEVSESSKNLFESELNHSRTTYSLDRITSEYLFLTSTVGSTTSE